LGLFRRKRTEDDAPAEKRSTFRLPPGPSVPWTYGTTAGVVVTHENALQSAAVAACVRVLKTTIANLPVDEVIVQRNVRTPVEASPVVRRPSGKVSQRQFVAQFAHSLITAGNMYAKAGAFDAAGRPLQVDTIDPADVKWWHVGDELTPHVKGQPQAVWPRGDFIHVPATAFLRPGCPVADSPVDLANEAIGTALAAEKFGAGFFGDGAHPSSLIYSDQELTAEDARHIKAQFLAAINGREPGVFGSGLKYEQVQVDPKDSQFIDLLRFEVEQACRFFGVPPSMVYAAISGQNITYANVSESDLTFLKYSVTSWLLDIEDAWSSWLTQPRVVKFNTSALLRMDASKRHEIYERRLNSHTITINEVRALEDEKPFDGDEYDEPGIPGGEAPTPEPPDEEPPSE
jgi:HK97 family phage portal protein